MRVLGGALRQCLFAGTADGRGVAAEPSPASRPKQRVGSTNRPESVAGEVLTRKTRIPRQNLAET
jgi:hypothetical protein